MKQVLFFLLLLSSTLVWAGDTITVQAFTYGSPQQGKFLFPSVNTEVEKILMLYRLKCNPAQNPACGEWDYLTYTYVYKPTGRFDSTVQKIDTIYNSDSTSYTIDTTWKKNEIKERFEIGRYITPYGINLDLGPGFTWVFDVTDYQSILSDSVEISAGNWQELLDLKFIFIKGESARKPYKVVNLWNGNPGYGTGTSIENFLKPLKVKIDPDATSTRLKVRVTGHGFGGNENCAEFCAKDHKFLVNGTQRYNKLVWRDDCATNPVYPQGGTWVYQRANWCPGAEVETYDFELTPFVTKGDSVTLDYDVEQYTWNGQGSTPYYAIETQLVYYNESNFSVDASVEDIIRPSTADLHRRKNPICSNSIIKVKNNGTTEISKLKIQFGVKGQAKQEYEWTGTLKSMESKEITLPYFDWKGISPGTNQFEVSILEVNSQTDEYTSNNVMSSSVNFPPLHDSKLLFYIRTNNAGEENSYTIKDGEGKVIFSRANMGNQKTYLDTLDLPNGCFVFTFEDTDEDGINWWANSDGAGNVRIFSLSGNFNKTFGGDFGKNIVYEFKTGGALSSEEFSNETDFVIYPNPNNGSFKIDFKGLPPGPSNIKILDLNGKVISESGLIENPVDYQQEQRLSAGVYIISISNSNRTFHKKLIVQ